MHLQALRSEGIGHLIYPHANPFNGSIRYLLPHSLLRTTHCLRTPPKKKNKEKTLPYKGTIGIVMFVIWRFLSEPVFKGPLTLDPEPKNHHSLQRTSVEEAKKLETQ